MEKSFNVSDTIKNYYLANNPALFFITDETYRVQEGAEQAREMIKKDRKENVNIVCHDKVSGFHIGKPGVRPPDDGTNVLLNALPLMVMSPKEINDLEEKLKKQRQNFSGFDLPFDPKEDVIFVLKDVDHDLNDSQSKSSVAQIFRNIIQSNMCSYDFYGEDVDGEHIRGRRMFVLVSPTENIPTNLPELDPIIVPLPDDEMIDNAIVNVLDPLVGHETKDGNKLKKLAGKNRDQIIKSLHGMPLNKIEDTLALAAVEHGGYHNLEPFVGTLDRRRALIIESTPGLQYVDYADIPFKHLPGYEELINFLEDRAHISPEIAKKHNMQALKGFTMVGVPGVGKTVAAMMAALILRRCLCIWNLGETQEGLVGASERNARRVINTIQSLDALVLIDDADKAGTNVAQTGQSGDSGTFGHIIQMLLTEMSKEENRVVWVFTANRVQNIPPELIRPGRMDERFFIQRPDPKTRLNILNLHRERHKMGVDNEETLKKIADRHTNDWVGAELADLVKEATIRAIRTKSDVIDTEWMIYRAGEIIPMADQKVYAQDLQAMEEVASQFRKIGRINDTTGTSKPQSDEARSKRSVSVGV